MHSIAIVLALLAALGIIAIGIQYLARPVWPWWQPSSC